MRRRGSALRLHRISPWHKESLEASESTTRCALYECTHRPQPSARALPAGSRSSFEAPHGGTIRLRCSCRELRVGFLLLGVTKTVPWGLTFERDCVRFGYSRNLASPRSS